MTTTLITGGNKGLGYETARRLIEVGHEVWIGSRDAGRGAEAAARLGARSVQLDVTDDASVARAVDTVAAAGGLDVLINNAGVGGPLTGVVNETVEDVVGVLDVNVVGVVRVTRAALPLLRASSHPVIVTVASSLGSFGRMTDPDRDEFAFPTLAYAASKAAVAMATVQLARALPEMRVNVVDPGFTRTDLNDNHGPQTVEEGTDAIVRLAQIGPDGVTGGYFDRFGAVPW